MPVLWTLCILALMVRRPVTLPESVSAQSKHLLYWSSTLVRHLDWLAKEAIGACYEVADYQLASGGPK